VERRPLAADRHQGRRTRRALAPDRRATRLRHRQKSRRAFPKRVVGELFRRDEQKHAAVRAAGANGEGINENCCRHSRSGLVAFR
jgi:hypothetical protein